MIQKFRKKPVVIEAMKYWNNNEHHVIAWLKESGIDALMWEHEGKGAICIPTLEGDHLAMPNDYIIKGVKGEFYPCKPDIFEMTYEPAPPKAQEAE